MSQVILPKFPKPAKPKAQKVKKSRRSKAEWLEKFAAVPARPKQTAEESAKQRALFERHDAAVVSIRLPMPPSVNHYWRTVMFGRQPRVLISSEGRAYKEAVAKCCSKIFEPATGRLRVLALICYGDRRSIDLDNRTKALLDSMTEAGVWSDDSQIDDLRVLRGPVDPSGIGFVDVTIETIGE